MAGHPPSPRRAVPGRPRAAHCLAKARMGTTALHALARALGSSFAIKRFLVLRARVLAIIGDAVIGFCSRAKSGRSRPLPDRGAGPRAEAGGPALRHAPLRHTSWGKARSPTPRSALCSRSGHRSPARDKIWMCGLSVRDSHACPAAAPQAGAEAEPGVRTWVRTGAPLSPAPAPRACGLGGSAPPALPQLPPSRPQTQRARLAQGHARPQAPPALCPRPRVCRRTRPHARRVSR